MFNILRYIILLIALGPLAVESAEALYLRENLKRAQKGDFIVTAQNKNYTLLHIFDKNDNKLTVEEITVPLSKFPRNIQSWRQWVNLRAPGNTSWVLYTLDLSTAQMLEYYSVSKNVWYDTSQADSFLTTLLNLRMEPIPLDDRKRVGIPPFPGMTDRRPLWQPRMVVDGLWIEGVEFDAWTTEWPKDSSDLSGKTIEVYVPAKNNLYPSYFPYWLQISGMIGNAKIRIIDSGSHMTSPAPSIESRRPNQLSTKVRSE